MFLSVFVENWSNSFFQMNAPPSHFVSPLLLGHSRFGIRSTREISSVQVSNLLVTNTLKANGFLGLEKHMVRSVNQNNAQNLSFFVDLFDVWFLSKRKGVASSWTIIPKLAVAVFIHVFFLHALGLSVTAETFPCPPVCIVTMAKDFLVRKLNDSRGLHFGLNNSQLQSSATIGNDLPTRQAQPRTELRRLASWLPDCKMHGAAFWRPWRPPKPKSWNVWGTMHA